MRMLLVVDSRFLLENTSFSDFIHFYFVVKPLKLCRLIFFSFHFESNEKQINKWTNKVKNDSILFLQAMKMHFPLNS